MARKHGPEALKRLVQLMKSHNERVAVMAAQAVLDRGYGRPPQALELGNGDTPLSVSIIVKGVEPAA